MIIFPSLKYFSIISKIYFSFWDNSKWNFKDREALLACKPTKKYPSESVNPVNQGLVSTSNSQGFLISINLSNPYFLNWSYLFSVNNLPFPPVLVPL